MQEQKDKNIEAIAKIISLTREDRLTWRSVDISEVQNNNSDDEISSVFVTTYKNKILRVYQRKYKGPTLASKIRMFVDAKESQMTWYSEIVLELVNHSGHSLWSFPKEDILKDLLKVIKYKVSGADELINSLLNE